MNSTHKKKNPTSFWFITFHFARLGSDKESHLKTILDHNRRILFISVFLICTYFSIHAFIHPINCFRLINCKKLYIYKLYIKINILIYKMNQLFKFKRLCSVSAIRNETRSSFNFLSFFLINDFLVCLFVCNFF